jgi:hypothetical protein
MTTKFQSGTSGNPAGRPKDKTPATLLRKSINDKIPEILNAMIESALNGDMQTARVLLDKVCPALRPQALPINLLAIDSLTGQGDEIIKATMAGQIPPDIGSMLITALANQGKLIEIQEMAKRLADIEKQLASRK